MAITYRNGVLRITQDGTAQKHAGRVHIKGLAVRNSVSTGPATVTVTEGDASGATVLVVECPANDTVILDHLDGWWARGIGIASGGVTDESVELTGQL